MSELTCAACGGGVHLMSQTTFGGPDARSTTFYLLHVQPRTECKGALAAELVQRLAREGEARERAEAKRFRKPAKKEYHEARAAMYHRFGKAGLGVPV